ncbi:hypothetical protein ABL78_2133 [Leptomonas seymouri]|uniref:Uncharacterized protein n=1 Tax=Leptomonas seymouri TaxID=5684 RepID=A0A0N1PFI2_LEPSE|nr:hypothetical protein ABL78_2133 [Leptomonas seymouri]|eukprot:KPI88754.1 hypothetical protein ABL78_2133 [Leptomonas seymouri]
MLSFLIEKCGADAAEVPQLVKLNNLLLEEDDGEAAAAPTVKPASQGDNNGGARSGVVDSRRQSDNTMLSFLLDTCAVAEERMQFPVLQQMRSWLLQEAELPENATEDIEANAPAAARRAKLDSAGTANPPGGSGSSTTRYDTFQLDNTMEGSKSPTLPPLPATTGNDPRVAPGANAPAPILPSSGSWKGSTTACTSPSPLQASQPSLQASAARKAEADSAETHTEGDANAISSCQKNSARHTDTKAPDYGGVMHRGLTGAKLSEGAVASSTLPRSQRILPTYAGRMPCPASEAMSVLNSATVRLLSRAGVTSKSSRPSSVPPTSCPMSGFTRRFMANLYERVSTLSPRAADASEAAPLSQEHVLCNAHGSGMRAAREHYQLQHQQQQQTTSFAPTGTEVWHTGAAAGARGSTAAADGAAALSLRGTVGPCRPSPPAPARSTGRRTSGPESRQRRSSLSRPTAVVGHPPSVALPCVGAAARSVHRPSSAAHGQPAGRTPGSADPVGLMVVGARIRLPSTAPKRSQYA